MDQKADNQRPGLDRRQFLMVLIDQNDIDPKGRKIFLFFMYPAIEAKKVAKGR